MNLLRAFIAIEIPPEIKKAIAAHTDDLQKNTGNVVRWVAAGNIHLTLKFLGEISPANVELLSQAMSAECSRHAPFSIDVNGLGCFPNSRRPHIIWIGLIAPADLSQLQHNIESAAARLGYEGDDKPFSPHLTIGRVREQVSPAQVKQIHDVIEAQSVGALGTFTAQNVSLFKSDLKPSGPIYTPLYCATLGV